MAVYNCRTKASAEKKAKSVRKKLGKGGWAVVRQKAKGYGVYTGTRK